MLFSIIVPVYNVEVYLERCVASLVNQTFGDIEIVLIDDGSTDGCPELCDHFAKVDRRIRVVHQKNGGLSIARNAGLEVARGEYILFVDSDDYIDTNTCERLSVFANQKYDILTGQAYFEGGKPIQYLDEMGVVYTGKNYMLKVLQSKAAYMAVWLNAYHRSCLLESGLSFKPSIVHEDELFTPKAILNAKTVVCTGVMFYHYTVRREGAITAQKDKRKNLRDLYSSYLELEEYYAINTDGELRQRLLDYMASMYLMAFQEASAYRYGREYYHKDFVKRVAKLPKTRIRSILYRCSPAMYCYLDSVLKSVRELGERC